MLHMLLALPPARQGGCWPDIVRTGLGLERLVVCSCVAVHSARVWQCSIGMGTRAIQERCNVTLLCCAHDERRPTGSLSDGA
jgi:hypothetical protein